MPKFKVVTASTGTQQGAFEYEMEALGPIGAEIVEVPATSDAEFLAGARDADAVIGGGRPMTRAIIEGLENCKVIALGSVGTDQVDVDAATERGIPVTNVPDTFIDEVADHTMSLILGTFRRITLMDRMVREGRWKEGRPFLYHSDADGTTYALLSYSTDGQYDQLGKAGPTSSYNCDIVFSNGDFVQWPGRIRKEKIH